MNIHIRRWWPVGVIVVLWLLFSFPYWVKGLIPFPSRYLVTFFPPWSALYGMAVKNNAMPDVITQIYPWKQVTIDSWSHGEVPLWNPYSFGGTTQAGNYQSAVFSPINLLFFILPMIHAWSVMILLQPILAGMFMFLWLKSLKISGYGSVIGSVAFMFCGFMTVWMAYGTLGYAALFLPLALYAVNMHTAGKRWAALLLSVALALSFVSGHFQISLYVFLFTSIYVGFFGTPGLIPYLFVALFLAAPQILPSFDAYNAAGRSSSFAKGEIIPWSYLVTLFAPDFYGNPVTRNDWFGHYAEWASFVGVAPLLLASIGIWFKHRDRLVRFLIISGGVFLLLALPTPLNDWMYALHIPVLSTSSASRIIVLVSFVLATLSALGADVIEDFWHKKSYRFIVWWLVLILVFVAAFWASLKLLHPLPPDKLVVAMRNSYLPTLLLLTAALVTFMGFVIPTSWKKFLMIILVLISAFDMYRYAAKWMPFDPKAYVYPLVPVISHLHSLTDSSQARIEGNIFNEVNSTFAISSLEGYDAVYQKRYGQFISALTDGSTKPLQHSVVLVDKHGKYTEEMLQLLGVRYVAQRVSDGRYGWAYPYWDYPSYHSVWKDHTYEIFENSLAFPRAYLASSYAVSHSDDEILRRVLAPETDRRETLILETEPEIKPATGAGTATIVSYRPTKVEIVTQSNVPKLLFLSDVFDPGWHAALDGNVTPVYRADYDFRAVSVPAGRHTVTMWYWPVSETWGLTLAGFGTLWCILSFLRRKSV